LSLGTYVSSFRGGQSYAMNIRYKSVHGA
jgi:hypothetical protein